MINELVGLNIELTNLCTLKCPGCPRTQMINQWPNFWKNHSLDIDQLSQFLDIDLRGKMITFCGNTGDCIYHPKFHEFLSWFKDRGCQIRIFTNGSYRTQDWWAKTVSYLDELDMVIFSVDGLPENFTQYRINADWESIHTAMQICVEATCKTVWKYIVFKYNENDIPDAQQLSKQIGIDIFRVETSSRFDDHTAQYIPSDKNNVDVKFTPQKLWKNNIQSTDVDPVCNDNNQHYISAEGYYSPCCYIADHRFYYKNEFGKNKKSYSIANHTLTQIITRPTVVEFYQDLTSKPVCQYNCPAT